MPDQQDTPARRTPPDAAGRALVYDLAAHRDAATAAAVVAGRLSRYPCERGTPARARVLAFAHDLDSAGSPLMAALARRVAAELDAHALQPAAA